MITSNKKLNTETTELPIFFEPSKRRAQFSSLNPEFNKYIKQFFNNLPLNREFTSLSLWPINNGLDQIDKYFKDSYANFISYRNLLNTNFHPTIDMIEDEKDVKIEIEMPGFEEKHIKLAIQDSVLTIKATKETSQEDKQKKYIMHEIRDIELVRSINLIENLDTDNAKASINNGVLTIIIPKNGDEKQQIHEVKVEKNSKLI